MKVDLHAQAPKESLHSCIYGLYEGQVWRALVNTIWGGIIRRG